MDTDPFFLYLSLQPISFAKAITHLPPLSIYHLVHLLESLLELIIFVFLNDELYMLCFSQLPLPNELFNSLIVALLLKCSPAYQEGEAPKH